MPVLAKRLGAQLSLVEQSPNYRDGQFHNQLTPDSPARKHAGRVVGFSGHETRNVRPQQPLPLVNTDLAGLPSGEDVMVWARSLIVVSAAGGKRIDPVFGRLRRAVLFHQ